MSGMAKQEIDALFSDLMRLARENKLLASNSYLERDNALHTCSETSYPSWMEPALTMETHHHVDWSPELIRIVREFVATEINLSEGATLEIKNLGGLWPTLITHQSYQVGFYEQGLRSWVPLEVEIQGISLKIEKLIDDTALKDMVFKFDIEGQEIYRSLANSIEKFNKSHELDSSDDLKFVEDLRSYERPAIKREQISEFVYLQVMRQILENAGPCKHFEETLCLACGEFFYPQAIANSIRVMGASFCAGCISLATDDYGRYTRAIKGKRAQREFAVDGLKAFVEIAGYLPGADLKPSKFLGNSPIHGLPNDEAKDLLKAWAIVPRPGTVKSLFPSWAHLLDAAGLLEGEYSPKARGRRSISSCKHLCLSLGERYICEFLNTKKISHTREPEYPQHDRFNPNGKLRADFLIGDLWVEFAGLKGQSAYDSRMENKVKFGQELALNLLIIEPKDLGSLEKIFASTIRFKP
jgi:hypothetical protein